MMIETPTKEPRLTRFTVSLGAPIMRLLEELAIVTRTLNRSELMRAALVEKADRDLPGNWREAVGFDETEAA